MALVIDAANVVGSRPDGWWRDRAGAAERLLGQVSEALRAGTLTGPVVIVLDRGLRARVLAAGGTVLPPSWLLDRLR